MAGKRIAEKKIVKGTSGARGKRRTDEELIADLKTKIAEVEARKRARELENDPAAKLALSLARALQRAAAAGEKSLDPTFRHAVADAHAAIACYLQGRGVKLPKVGRPKGRRPAK